MNSGIILLAHGSRRETANEVLPRLAEMVKEEGKYDRINCAFLQFTSPDLREALKEQAEDGIEEITVVPVFLFNGIHLQEDIPEILAEEKNKYPQVEIKLAAPLGADPRLGEIIKDRINEARAGV